MKLSLFRTLCTQNSFWANGLNGQENVVVVVEECGGGGGGDPRDSSLF